MYRNDREAYTNLVERRIGMTLNLTKLSSFNYPNTPEKYRPSHLTHKPIEIYVFVDPLCPDCWALDSYFKKLTMEFGRFFTVRPIISNYLRLVDDHNLLTKHDENVTFYPSVNLAIKAAELQGSYAGRAFLRKIQQNYFLKSKNIFELDVLIQCAYEANLDINEFKKDLYSTSAKKAFQADINISKEMKANEAPTIVFFNQVAEDDGLKIVGLNQYDVFLMILNDMLNKKLIPAEKPPLEDFLAFYDFVSQEEIAFIFDYTTKQTNQAMKKLQLKQKVKEVKEDNQIFWKYIK